ncbi:hypothetical protein HPB48_007528 [Haemaphysalis longicornis]|uniref:Uncharacterized protein n=1 Tax=Haemaphysalis longicornis TaxID=44386 RepID=A0A9J6GTZ5_HAELO|nr:hypothetical protein HPB48_007528 [Haemaphysalis longicornis]
MYSRKKGLLVYVVDDEAPWRMYSVCFKADLSVTVHVMKSAIKKVGANVCVPETATIKRDIAQLLEGIEKWDGGMKINSVAELYEAVCLVLNLLSTSQEEDGADCIRFLKEQITLYLARNSADATRLIT